MLLPGIMLGVTSFEYTIFRLYSAWIDGIEWWQASRCSFWESSWRRASISRPVAVELGDVVANGAGVSCGTVAVAASKPCPIHQTTHVCDLVAVVAEGVVPATRQ